MILKRQEKEGKIKAVYASTNILASTYDTETNDLTLIFNKGGQYKYPNVSFTDYTRFELAESQGVVFSSHIKKYSFEKLESIEPKEIIEEINNLKIEENKIILEGKQLKLVSTMQGIIESTTKQFITESQLVKLQEEINNYLTYINKNNN